MIDRVGQSYRVDHGAGHVSVRLVTARAPAAVEYDPSVWELVCFDSDGSVRLVRYTERDLSYWDQISDRGGNVTRLT